MQSISDSLLFLQALLEHNAKVYLAARSRERAEAAIQDLQKQTGKTAIFLELDMSSLASVRKAAEEFMRYSLLVGVLAAN